MADADHARYAVYFMPAPSSALWGFGCAAIGFDALTGEDVPLLDHAVFAEPGAAGWIAEPQRYGFHGTLKAPFELASEQPESLLMSAAARFASSRTPFALSGLRVARLGSFLALIPKEESPELQDLAADCVRAFEPYRAPLAVADRARRLRSPLTASQIANLDQWGYPYVFADFRFHMTLTGSLASGDLAHIEPALRTCYAPLDNPVPIDGLAVFKQAGRQARFRVIGRFAFSGT